MKHIDIQIIAFVALVTLGSCVRLSEPMEMEGGVVRFTASAVASGAGEPVTRTSFGSVSGSTQNLLWTAGDRVAIWSPEAVILASGAISHPAAAYVIDGQDDQSEYGKATGITAAVASNRLQWGTAATHVFYGKYPDPTWNEAAPHAHAAFANQDPASSSFLCWLPGTLSVTPETGTYSYSQDMSYCYMTAYSTAARNATVDMTFSQAVSAFRITIPHGFVAGGLRVSRVTLSSASHRLNGEFTVNIGASTTCTVPETSLTEADRTVSMEFATPVVVPNSASLCVTLFTCPVTVSDLTLTIDLADGMTLTHPLKATGGDWTTFPAGKVFEITCGAVPEIGPQPVFTVDAQGRSVIFSRGNLQYIGSAETPYYKFADNPWDYFGETTGQNSSATNVDRDLLGWGTGDGLNISGNSEIYSHFTDWGINPIVNGGDYTWRTLTQAEWMYLFSGRSCSPRFARATVAGVNGVILFPDNYDHPYGVRAVNNADDVYGRYADNSYNATDWSALESVGCAFLPAAGFRTNATLYLVGSRCDYWSSTPSSTYSSIAYYWDIWSSGAVLNNSGSRSHGFAVRLVRDVTPAHPFSVGEYKKVAFSRGNLMAKIDSYSSPVATASEWKFGEPTEVIGDDPSGGNYLFAHGSSDCVGKWVDLFSWQGASIEVNHPSYRAHGLVNSLYNADYHGGGSSGDEYYELYHGGLYDGCWNGLPISNGGGYNWRVLNISEWEYLLEQRDCSPSYVTATIDGQLGLVLFPDDYVHPSGVAPIISENTFDAATWSALESAGCIFLPAAGYRRGNEVSMGDYYYMHCCYWTRSFSHEDIAEGWCSIRSLNSLGGKEDDLWPLTVSIDNEFSREYGFSVRLVRDL